jgi:mono/diheme cytochrome c family protein
MKKILFVTLLVAVACSSKKLFVLTQADADLAAAKYPGMTLADLEEGHRLYTANCQKCHGLKKPQKYSEARLNTIVPIMADKAKIDQATEDKILHYMVTLSQRTKK